MNASLRFAALCLFTTCGGLAACGSPPYQASQPAPQKAEAARPAAEVSQVSENEGAVPIAADDPVWGSRWAPVTIVEFADFQCSFCERAEQTLKQLQTEYGPEKLRVVWKNNPLAFHADAGVLAEAGQGVFAAGGNDAFWKFHDAAYAGMKARAFDDDTREQRLPGTAISSWAQNAGVEGKKVLIGLDKHTWTEKIQRDVDLAIRLEVTGTPIFFINGVKLEGARKIEEFRAIIDAEAKSASSKTAAGSSRDRVYLERTALNRSAAQAEEAEARAKDDPSNDKSIYKVPLGTSPILGPKAALITIVEFSDFECPFCKRAQETVKTVIEKHKNDVRLVWKNNPLPFHQHAMRAAELAVEAQVQKGDAGFWAVHDKLFERAPALDDASLDAIGGEVRLDPAKLRAAYGSKRIGARIEADQWLADDLEARGTPTYFVNGRRIAGAQPIEVFEKVIEQELERARGALAKGVAPAKLYDTLVKDGKGAPEPERKTVPKVADAPARGNPAAKVTIVEFSDFQCPYCQRVTGTVDQILKDYDGRVKLVFRHLPLPFHPNAHLAAEASMEAYRQKGSAGFFKMHDLLFGQQSQLERAALEGLAEKLSLDRARFAEALDSHRHGARVDADAKAAADAGIQGTPAFVINGYYLSGAVPYRSFKRLVERALAESGAKPSEKGR